MALLKKKFTISYEKKTKSNVFCLEMSILNDPGEAILTLYEGYFFFSVNIYVCIYIRM